MSTQLALAAIAAPLATSPIPPYYEDKVPEYTTVGYWETNEEPEVHSELLSGIRIERAAAIASGGEVSFFTLLPKVRRELILVDHSYNSLAVSYAKALLLNKLGPYGTKDLFLSADSKRIIKELNSIREFLPKPLDSTTYIPDSYTQMTSINNLRREWHFGSLRSLCASAKKLAKMKFIHGDLRDLKEMGPFDLVYISNAMEHQGRHGGLTREVIETLLKKNGLVLSTSTQYGTSLKEARWKVLNQIKGFRTGWTHSLFQIQ